MFFTFHQNNSGGSFQIDDNVTQFVIIEAENAIHANNIADSIGIYFDGCENDLDCSCCGDRWYRVTDYDGTDKPMIYNKDPSEHKPRFIKKGYAYCYVYYLDASRAVFSVKE